MKSARVVAMQAEVEVEIEAEVDFVAELPVRAAMRQEEPQEKL